MTSPSNLIPVPLPNKDLSGAKSAYVELYGSTAVMNTYLKIAVVALCVVCAAQAILGVKMFNALRHVPPVIIRVNDVGRADVIKLPTIAEYQPQELEIKYFLADFVERHYGRMRATLRDNYARSLYFLDRGLADSLVEANRKTHAIETFLTDTSDEIEISIKNVVIEDLRKPPYRATVDFEKRYYGPDRTVHRTERYLANFVFVVQPEVPNGLIPVNPLGLTITYFREDQAFQ